MSDFESVAIPFQTRGNRQFLSYQQLMELPWLIDFIKGFPHCFETDFLMGVVWFDPEGKVALEDQPKFLRSA